MTRRAFLAGNAGTSVRKRILLQLVVFLGVVTLTFLAIVRVANRGFLSIGESADAAIAANRTEFKRVLAVQENMFTSDFHNDILNLSVGNLKKRADALMETNLYQSIAFFDGNGNLIYAITIDAYKQKAEPDKAEKTMSEFTKSLTLPPKEKEEATALADKSPENQVVLVKSESSTNVLPLLRRVGQKSQADGWIFSRFDLSPLTQIESNLIAQKEAKSQETSRTLVLWGGLSAAVLLSFVILQVRSIGKVLKPIDEVTQAATQMALGDFSHKISHQGEDELGNMAEAFREMQVAQRDKSDHATRFAEGDLSECAHPSSPQDDLGNALFSMFTNWNKMITEIRGSATNVTSCAHNIRRLSSVLETGSTEQAAAMEETSSTMNEIDTKAKNNLQMAKEAMALVKKVEDASRKSDQSMRDMVKAMAEIRESNTRISSIIKLTDDIAFQTNLLALNAAVEAARAGRHGKGFAVVADEVRNLAGRSAQSAKETAELINESGAKVNRGSEIAESTAVALKEIHALVTKAESLVGAIADESDRQAAGIAQLASGLQRIANITQETAESSHLATSEAVTLDSEAENLNQFVSRFKLAQQA